MLRLSQCQCPMWFFFFLFGEETTVWQHCWAKWCPRHSLCNKLGLLFGICYSWHLFSIWFDICYSYTCIVPIPFDEKGNNCLKQGGGSHPLCPICRWPCRVQLVQLSISQLSFVRLFRISYFTDPTEIIKNVEATLGERLGVIWIISRTILGKPASSQRVW